MILKNRNKNKEKFFMCLFPFIFLPFLLIFLSSLSAAFSANKFSRSLFYFILISLYLVVFSYLPRQQTNFLMYSQFLSLYFVLSLFSEPISAKYLMRYIFLLSDKRQLSGTNDIDIQVSHQKKKKSFNQIFLSLLLNSLLQSQ